MSQDRTCLLRDNKIGSHEDDIKRAQKVASTYCDLRVQANAMFTFECNSNHENE